MDNQRRATFDQLQGFEDAYQGRELTLYTAAYTEAYLSTQQAICHVNLTRMLEPIGKGS